MPRADSTRAITGVWPPSRCHVSVTCAGDSVFASITPCSPGRPRSSSTSSAQKSVVTSLIRTQASPPPASHAATPCRAAGFAAGSTASSMSRMIWSARERWDCRTGRRRCRRPAATTARSRRGPIDAGSARGWTERCGRRWPCPVGTTPPRPGPASGPRRKPRNLGSLPERCPVPPTVWDVWRADRVTDGEDDVNDDVPVEGADAPARPGARRPPRRAGRAGRALQRHRRDRRRADDRMLRPELQMTSPQAISLGDPRLRPATPPSPSGTPGATQLDRRRRHQPAHALRATTRAPASSSRRPTRVASRSSSPARPPCSPA